MMIRQPKPKNKSSPTTGLLDPNQNAKDLGSSQLQQVLDRRLERMRLTRQEHMPSKTAEKLVK